METKPIRLSPKKAGNGYISSYSINLGISEVRECGFIDADGNLLPIEKCIDTVKGEIIIKLRID